MRDRGQSGGAKERRVDDTDEPLQIGKGKYPLNRMRGLLVRHRGGQLAERRKKDKPRKVLQGLQLGFLSHPGVPGVKKIRV